MQTFQAEIKELEKKQLEIRIGWKFKRKHGNQDCVKVDSYDNEWVNIMDKSGIVSPVHLRDFTTDNFKRGDK